MAIEVSTGDIDSLASKLDGLDLTEAERSILVASLMQAGEMNHDVAGFARRSVIDRGRSGERVVIDFTGAGADLKGGDSRGQDIRSQWADLLKIVVIGDPAG